MEKYLQTEIEISKEVLSTILDSESREHGYYIGKIIALQNALIFYNNLYE